MYVNTSDKNCLVMHFLKKIRFGVEGSHGLYFAATFIDRWGLMIEF